MDGKLPSEVRVQVPDCSDACVLGIVVIDYNKGRLIFYVLLYYPRLRPHVHVYCWRIKYYLFCPVPNNKICVDEISEDGRRYEPILIVVVKYCPSFFTHQHLFYTFYLAIKAKLTRYYRHLWPPLSQGYRNNPLLSGIALKPSALRNCADRSAFSP